MSRWQREGVFAVYTLINELPVAGGGTQTQTARSLGRQGRHLEIVRGPAQLVLDSVMHGDAQECKERIVDLKAARREAEGVYEDERSW